MPNWRVVRPVVPSRHRQAPRASVMAGLVPAIHRGGCGEPPWMPGTSPGMTDPKPRRRLRSCLPNRHVVGPHVPSRHRQAPHFCPGRACPGHPSRRVWRGRMDARAKPWQDRPETTSQAAILRSLCRPVFPRGPKRPAVSPGPSSSGPAKAIRGAPPHENRFRAGQIGISGLFPGEQRSAGRSGKVVTVGIESDPRPNLEANGDQP